MSEQTFSEQLRELTKNYYQHQLRFAEYRELRRQLLIQIDAEFNGVVVQEDNTVRKQPPSLINKAIGIFRDND